MTLWKIMSECNEFPWENRGHTIKVNKLVQKMKIFIHQHLSSIKELRTEGVQCNLFAPIN